MATAKKKPKAKAKTAKAKKSAPRKSAAPKKKAPARKPAAPKKKAAAPKKAAAAKKAEAPKKIAAPARKPAASSKPKPAEAPARGPAPGEVRVGVVTHYFSHLSVATVKLDVALAVGQTIRVLGHTSDFRQRVASIQIEHEQVQEAIGGDEVGLKVAQHAREHDVVYRVPV
jgi:hypothetical protein